MKDLTICLGVLFAAIITVRGLSSAQAAEKPTIVNAESTGHKEDHLRKGDQLFPASDPANAGGWVLNKDMSGEFEGRELDAAKWLVQGTNDEYQSGFIGRAPSQFSTKNVRVEDGKLKIFTGPSTEAVPV